MNPSPLELVRVDEPRSEEERELYRMLHELKVRYELEAKPIVDALVRIESCKVPRYFVSAPQYLKRLEDQ
jgi:hypothetical protein